MTDERDFNNGTYGAVRRGILGGLISTLVMDVAMVVLSWLTGDPIDIFFSFIGEAATAFAKQFGFDLGHAPAWGCVLHHLIGLSLGFLYNVVYLRVERLRNVGFATSLVAAVAFEHLASVLFLLPAVLLLRMSEPDILQRSASPSSFILSGDSLWVQQSGTETARDPVSYPRVRKNRARQSTSFVPIRGNYLHAAAMAIRTAAMAAKISLMTSTCQVSSKIVNGG